MMRGCRGGVFRWKKWNRWMHCGHIGIGVEGDGKIWKDTYMVGNKDNKEDWEIEVRNRGVW